MKLGTKSREALEVLLLLGCEFVEGALTLHSFYRFNSFRSQKSFRQCLAELRERGLVEYGRNARGSWVASLTQNGKASVYQDLDPRRLWDEAWDGQWRLLTFDLPSAARSERRELDHWLRERRFGKLQGSVRISPRDFGDWDLLAAELELDPSSVLYIVGKLPGPERDKLLVTQAWDFETLHQLYHDHLSFLEKNPPGSVDANHFSDWFRNESARWRAAFELDPFLPRELWPSDFQKNYLGPKSFRLRQESYAIWRSRLLGAPTQSP